MSKCLSVVVPMYNESKIVKNTAKTFAEYFDEKLGDNYEIIFSDDGSTDGCAEIVKRLGLPCVRVIRYSDNRGKGSAVREGIKAAEGDIIVYTDCDLAYGCDAVYEMYLKLLNGGDHLVIGSRNLSADGYDGYTFLRKLMSKTYIKLIALIAGFRFTDSQCGIKGLCSDAARSIFDRCKVNGFAFDLEVLILAEKLKMKISEMPVKVINHRESDSKVHPLKDAIKMIRDVRKIKKSIK